MAATASPTFAISRVRASRSFRASMSSCLRRPATPPTPPEPQDENRAPAAEACPAMEIGLPYDLKHAVHIHYNFKEARFEGAPANFADLLAPAARKGGGGGGATAALSASISSLARTGKATAKRSRTASSAAATPANTKSCNTGACVPATPPRAESSANSSSGDGDDDALVALNQHFKLHFRQVPRVAVAGYDDRIPAVLLMLQEHFEAKQGFLLPHIFRESPNKAERDQAMREINSGRFAGAAHDVRVLADLIKLWFRELPVPIFHEIRSDRMEQILAMGGDTAARVLGALGGLERCIVLWLADLLAHVAAFQAQNHMGVDQLAIVIAPNLVRIKTENPMLAVALSKASVDLFRAVLRARFERCRRRATSTSPASSPLAGTAS